MNILKNNVPCVWKLMKRFTCRIFNPKSLKYLFFNQFNFCINKTQFSKSLFFQRKTMIFPNTAVYMWTPHMRSDWSNWPIKSHVGIWYALTCKQYGRGFQNLQIRLKIAKKNCRQVKIMTKRNMNIKNIFIMLQRGTNIMANKVQTPVQN